MNKIIIFIFLFLASCAHRQNDVILEFPHNEKMIVYSNTDKVSMEQIIEIADSIGADIITRDMLNVLMENEKNKSLFDCDDIECYSEIGKSFGARYYAKIVYRDDKQVLLIYDAKDMKLLLERKLEQDKMSTKNIISLSTGSLFLATGIVMSVIMSYEINNYDTNFNNAKTQMDYQNLYGQKDKITIYGTTLGISTLIGAILCGVGLF